MPDIAQSGMDVDAFFSWAEEPDGPWELRDGRIAAKKRTASSRGKAAWSAAEVQKANPARFSAAVRDDGPENNRGQEDVPDDRGRRRHPAIDRETSAAAIYDDNIWSFRVSRIIKSNRKPAS
jgi:hypothetical protein